MAAILLGGTGPKGGSFSGALQYTPLDATHGLLSISLKNVTDPVKRGYIVAFAFGNPAGQITGVALTFNNASLDLIGGPGYVRGIDCSNSTTGYGNADIGMTVDKAWGWNVPDFEGTGLRSWQQGDFVFALTGTGMNTLTEASFHGALTSGATPVFFPVHFRWINDEQSTAGDDYVASS